MTEAELARLDAAVRRAKREVLSDIRDGIVPAWVRDYGTLHDYVDANGYGGAFEDEWDFEDEDKTDEMFSFWNKVQDIVHEWLQQGRP